MNIYLLSCFLVRKILNNKCYCEEVVLKKSYFHGDPLQNKLLGNNHSYVSSFW